MNCLQLPCGEIAGRLWAYVTEITFVQSAASPLSVSWVFASIVLAIIVLLILWHGLSGSNFAGRIENQEARARAEALLRESLTHEEYQRLQREGYLEVQSTLYPHRLYRIPREQRRVQVYTRNEMGDAPHYHKLAELCVIAYDPVPYADLFLTQKWMLETNEKSYLSIANWIG